MYPEHNNTGGQLYYSTDNGKTWKPIGSITEIKIKLSEEDSAKLYGQLEGLEIVPNPERE
jgi:hypothetical protein